MDKETCPKSHEQVKSVGLRFKHRIILLSNHCSTFLQGTEQVRFYCAAADKMYILCTSADFKTH